MNINTIPLFTLPLIIGLGIVISGFVVILVSHYLVENHLPLVVFGCFVSFGGLVIAVVYYFKNKNTLSKSSIN